MYRFLSRIRRSIRGEIVLGFLIGTVFWSAVLGWQAAYAPSAVEKASCYEAAEKPGHKTEDCKSFWERSTSDPVAFFTLVLAISTIGLWIATIFLYRAGERQFRHGRRVAASQTRDTQASIAAAREANQLNRDNFERVNRPYVFVHSVKNIEAGPNEHFDAFVPYVIANNGQTPALIERVEYCLAPGNCPEETAAAWEDHPLIVSPVLGINQQIIAEANSVKWLDSGGRVVNLDAAEINQRGSGKRDSFVIPEIKVQGEHWFFWVKVFYRGPFSKGHETSGCWRYAFGPCQFVQFGGTEYNYTK